MAEKSLHHMLIPGLLAFHLLSSFSVHVMGVQCYILLHSFLCLPVLHLHYRTILRKHGICFFFFWDTSELCFIFVTVEIATDLLKGC